MRTVDDYLRLITPYNRGKPDFTATIEISTSSQADDQLVNYTMFERFDVDSAIQTQLDIVGQWVGVSRVVPVPVKNPWFALDTFGLGFDQGYWYVPGSEEVQLQTLDDDDYRALIRAKILANRGNGQFPVGQAVMNQFLIDYPATLVFVEDRSYAVDPPNPGWFALDTPLYGFDQGSWYIYNPEGSEIDHVSMGVVVGVAGIIPPPIYLAMLASNILPISPAGVHFQVLVISSDVAGGITPLPALFTTSAPGGATMSGFTLGGLAQNVPPSSSDDIISTPLFGFDMENEYISGFDVGVWGISPEALLAELA